MDETPDERGRRYDAWMASWGLMLQELHATTHELKEANRQQAVMNQRVERILAGVDLSVARLEVLTARVFRQDTNGTDA